MSSRRRWAARTVALVVVAGSIVATSAVGWLWVTGRREAMWATCTTRSLHHWGLGRLADAAVVYSAPGFTLDGPEPWSVWTSPRRRSDEYVLSTRGALGFRWATSAINAGDVYVAVPYWALLVAAVAPAGVVLIVWRRRAGRTLAGRCQRCGYDLRATPDRCPECGTPAG